MLLSVHILARMNPFGSNVLHRKPIFSIREMGPRFLGRFVLNVLLGSRAAATSIHRKCLIHPLLVLDSRGVLELPSRLLDHLSVPPNR